jgi:hypothetical protein
MTLFWTCTWCSNTFTSFERIKSHLDAQIQQLDELHKSYKDDIIGLRNGQESWRKASSHFLLEQPSRRPVNFFVNLD